MFTRDSQLTRRKNNHRIFFTPFRIADQLHAVALKCGAQWHFPPSPSRAQRVVTVASFRDKCQDDVGGSFRCGNKRRQEAIFFSLVGGAAFALVALDMSPYALLEMFCFEKELDIERSRK